MKNQFFKVTLFCLIMVPSSLVLFQNCASKESVSVGASPVDDNTLADSGGNDSGGTTSGGNDFDFKSETLAIGLYNSTLSELNVAYSGQYLKYPSLVKAVRIAMGSTSQTLIVGQTSKILYSRSDRLEFLISVNLFSKTATGITLDYADGNSSPEIPVDFYTATVYKPDSSVSNNWPLLLRQTAEGLLVIHNEFSLSFRTFNPTTNTWTKFDFPVAYGIPPFAYKNSAGVEIPSTISTNAEGEALDAQGNYWFSQGGSFPYSSGDLLNLARILKFNPVNKMFSVYNIPGNNRGVYGIALDDSRKRVWYNVGASVRPGLTARKAAIGYFDPSQVANDLLQNPSTTATCTGGSTTKIGTCSNNSAIQCFINLDCLNADRLCASSTSTRCYREAFVPGSMSGQIHVDGVGDAWFTGFWVGNFIGRFSVSLNKVFIYPLPPTRSPTATAAIVQSGPWDILQDDDGNIVVNEYFDNTIVRLRLSRKDDPLCLALNAQQKNPCLEEWDIPSANFEKHSPHSMTKENSGRIWFTHSGNIFVPPDPLIPPTLGVMPADMSEMYMLPGFNRLPGLTNHTGGNGIVVDRSSDHILWFNDYKDARLIKMMRLR